MFCGRLLLPFCALFRCSFQRKGESHLWRLSVVVWNTHLRAICCLKERFDRDLVGLFGRRRKNEQREEKENEEKNVWLVVLSWWEEGNRWGKKAQRSFMSNPRIWSHGVGAIFFFTFLRVDLMNQILLQLFLGVGLLIVGLHCKREPVTEVPKTVAVIGGGIGG